MAGSASSTHPSSSNVKQSFFHVPTTTRARSAQVLEQPVELVQSLNLVQTTVCAVVSTVASLRCLFPEDCFRTLHYDTENPNYTYKDFINIDSKNLTTVVTQRKKSDHRFVPWDILVRGKNAGATKLLDWIELGMLDALSHKYLATMQLSVYDGEVSSLKRLEAYVMVFSYNEDSVEMELQLSGTGGSYSPQGNTISAAKQELRYLVHRLANHIGGFPALCRKLHLPDFIELPTDITAHAVVNMHFTYNDTCPPSYEPPGFIMCRDAALVLQSNEGALVGRVHPGPHSMDLRVFLRESISNPLTMATLRRRDSNSRSADFTIPHETENTVTREGVPVLANLRQAQDPNQQLSQLSNITTILDTQERRQLASIDSMARLRPVQECLRDTQVLDMAVSAPNSRHGSIDLDDDPRLIEGSSTQGTPSTVSGRRSARLALRSAVSSLPKAFSVMGPRKRLATPGTEQLSKLRKVSEASSPFTRKHSKN